MKRILGVTLLVVLALALAIGAAAGLGIWLRSRQPANIGLQQPSIPGPYARPRLQQPFDRVPGAMRPGRMWNRQRLGRDGFPNGPQAYPQGLDGRFRMGRGMMPGGFWDNSSASGERISIDKAIELVQTYLSQLDSNLTAIEIMEFERNFYVVVAEKDTGQPAFELLVDPYRGEVFSEPGPNHLWNLKYGHMRAWGPSQPVQAETLTLNQAREEAQKYLDVHIPGARLEDDGLAFPGYYTFDYQVNSQIAGMLSVNAFSGQVWPHTWHGIFLQEKEIGK